ncbi:MAG: sugar ABC transporter permease [Aquiluna sp.]|jgi:multiple sugar transport system permease protein|tara:strand:- start:2377 stop:3288 length:912 start_codon:yes stop_codon:yes gene_type:complete
MLRHRSKLMGQINGMLMFLPYLVVLVMFAIVPIVMAFRVSLGPSRLYPEGGFGNYLFVFEDFRFLSAVGNVSLFLLIYLPAMLIVVAVLSLLLDTVQMKYTLPLRLAYLVPAGISGSVAILVWYFMLEPTYSPFAGIFAEIGLTEGVQIFNTTNLVYIFAIMAFFTGAGNWIVIQYGSLQSIPQDILEAARMDGANVFQQAFLIKLPLIRKYLVYMLILVFASGLQIFVEPYLISSSVYPGLAKDWSLNQLSYTLAFTGSNLGAAMALSMVMLLVSVIVALVIIYRTDFFDEARGKMKEKTIG